MNGWRSVPELAAFHAEPPQMPSGAVGKNGFLRLGFRRRDERTELADLDRRVPLLAQQALYWDNALPGLPCVFIISTAGGILQGDRYRLELALGPHAQAHVTTQAATKIHSMDTNFAAQAQAITLDDHAYLEYLPDVTIPHAHARFYTHTQITVAPTATLLYAEVLLGGRKHHKGGELFQFDLFSSTVQVQRPSGVQLLVEKYVVEPATRGVRHAAVMGDAAVFGNVLLLTPPEHAEAIARQTPAMFDRSVHCAAGISRLPNAAGLVYKVLGMETEPVRAAIRRFWATVRREVLGAELPTAFLWR